LPTTPKQRRLVSAYPSPGSEEADGERYVYGSEGEKYVLESAMTPKWKVGDIFATTPVKTPSGECCSPMFVEYDPDKELGHTRLPEKQRPSELETRRSSESKAIVPTTPLTPSIVHYRPNGVLPARARRTSIASIGKKSNGEVKLVKWDRVSDKGTAPLNIEPRPPPVPRVCILCYIVKRKVEPD
jgi:hypothetical protein